MCKFKAEFEVLIITFKERMSALIKLSSHKFPS